MPAEDELRSLCARMLATHGGEFEALAKDLHGALEAYLIGDPAEHTDKVLCPSCGAAIPIIAMDTRIAARYTCPTCRNEVLIEGDETAA